MAKHESTFNNTLGRALERSNPAWHDMVFTEESEQLSENKMLRVDILVAPKRTPPVAVETSFQKGDADKDAKARLGKHYAKTGDEIKMAVAVELDEKYRNVKRLVPNHKIKYAVFQKLPDGIRRFPPEGFMTGSYKDLSRILRAASIPREDMQKIAKEVSKLVTGAAGKLGDSISEKTLSKISKTLYLRSKLDGLRTTSLLWLNAYLVQSRLVQNRDKIEIPYITTSPGDCVRAWGVIRKRNWRDIFRPAIFILKDLRRMAPADTKDALILLNQAVQKIEEAKLGSYLNVGAELFPLLSSDRKESAAFYTQPSVAEFLAAMTITADMYDDWKDPKLFAKFKIADLTCGTGTLLRFAYRQVQLYHEHAGGTLESLDALHNSAMEDGLYGTDVSPIAAHLTSSSLAVMSCRKYGTTNIGWVGAGDTNRTGSIEYIAGNSVPDLFSKGVGVTSGTGDDTERSVVIKDGEISVVLMNPPYSRTRGGQSAFDIAGLSRKETNACQRRWGDLIKGKPCIKTAGMGATFLCVAAQKLKPGGKMGFVLPRTMAYAPSWSRTRAMIEEMFESIIVVVVDAGKALRENALSADTNMEEMMIIATKRATPPPESLPMSITV